MRKQALLAVIMVAGAAAPAFAGIPVPTPQYGAAAVATIPPAIPFGVGSTSPVIDYPSAWDQGAPSAGGNASNVAAIVGGETFRLPVVKPGVRVRGSDGADLGEIAQVQASGRESRVTLRNGGRSAVIDGRALAPTEGTTLLYDESREQVWGPGV